MARSSPFSRIATPIDDEFFNYDVYVMKLADKSIRRLERDRKQRVSPRWSPDGKMLAFQATKRGLTDRETTMEDTHAWVVNADGTSRREIGHDRQPPGPAGVDAGRPGAAVHGAGARQRASVSPADRGGKPEAGGRAIAERVGGFSMSENGAGLHARDAIRIWRSCISPARKMTDLNADVLRGKPLADVEIVHVRLERQQVRGRGVSHEADRPRRPAPAHPLIVNIHGGPHGQQGPAFNFKNQVYAARGWATLMVNYRGSTGYGQGIRGRASSPIRTATKGRTCSTASARRSRRYPWIDRDRLGVEGTSYGGQLSTWLITQTNIFKAAIPTAAITNIISYNYMTLLQPVRGDGVGRLSASGQPDGHAAAAVVDPPRRQRAHARRC